MRKLKGLQSSRLFFCRGVRSHRFRVGFACRSTNHAFTELQMLPNLTQSFCGDPVVIQVEYCSRMSISMSGVDASGSYFSKIIRRGKAFLLA